MKSKKSRSRITRPFAVEVNTYHVRRDEPNSIYRESFFLNPFNEFEQSGVNTWVGHYGNYKVTIIQHGRADVTEADVTIERISEPKPDVIYNMLSKSELVIVMNGYLDRLYD